MLCVRINSGLYLTCSTTNGFQNLSRHWLVAGCCIVWWDFFLATSILLKRLLAHMLQQRCCLKELLSADTMTLTDMKAWDQTPFLFQKTTRTMKSALLNTLL